LEVGLITGDRALQVTFLDLTITIDPSSRYITTKTCQKPQSLNLYIPSTSEHPDACLQGTLMVNVIRYWKQNSSPTEFGALLKQFTGRLSRRGHEKRAVMHGIDKATKYVDDNLTCRQTKMMAIKEVRTLLLHW
jgi:ribosomal protein L44E